MTRENFMVHVVDSDQAVADGLSTLLSTCGVEVLSYPDAESFLKFWLPRRACNCCLIVDADLPGVSGPALLLKLRELRVNIPVLMLIDKSQPEFPEVLRGVEQVGIVRKPCLDDTLIDRVLGFRRQQEPEPASRRESAGR